MQSKSSPIKIFILEDNDFYRELIKYNLSLIPDYEVHTFGTGRELLDNLHKNPHIVTLDFVLPDYTGDELIQKIKNYNNNIHVIVISEQRDIRTAVEMLRKGAFEYITKDEETRDHLLHAINKIVDKLVLQSEVALLRKELDKKYEFENIVQGRSESIKKVYDLMTKAVNSNINVSISGESGTGKEVVAKAIHYHSTKKNKPFVAVNVAAIPKDLLESELFGHEKGSFTGATATRIGKFEEADGGTLFLDEIGELDISLQAKLLRVLQEKEITRIGSNKVIKINCRIIIATHKNLLEEVKKNNFREDLYYRLMGLPIHMPSLRDRSSDILIIAKTLLDSFCRENMGTTKLSFTPDAQEKLLKHYYPGNIRELKAVIELAAVLCNGHLIEPHDIRFESAASINALTYEETTLEEYTMKIIKYFLEKYNDNVVTVAKKLDVGKSTIYRYIKEKKLNIAKV
ncbi:MAG: two-component response regulator [Bacteroidota bacterium]|jgi:DNA-binding NtrC family response regulator